jgi:8-oxo-dGTP pyrophosphatase MutT (NUDIX family)
MGCAMHSIRVGVCKGMRTKPAWFYQQSGVIPYRVVNGSFEILLITSRRRGRWIIPKGIVEPGFTPAASAQKEAGEEAGIVGSVGAAPVGEYRYGKWGGECTVQVFALEVQTMWDTWPEAAARKRQWMALNDAAHAVREPGLQQLIFTLPEALKGRTQ